ncbi:MAG: FGGY-family carbohydrate kinase [Clostridia bacterium]|nr:FGGY-family carbohydrate kinase [Clostridia bacterium]
MYVIAYDVGTTGLKSCLFEISKGSPIKLIAGEMGEYDLYILENGGVEQDPAQWWEAMCLTTHAILEKTGVAPEEIRGISFCAQMQAVVLVDEECNPVMNAMSYMDNRSVEQMKKGIQGGIKVEGMNVAKLLRSLQLTGAVSASVKDPVWKYRWVADNDPAAFARVYKWLDVKDFLVAKACGEFAMSRDSAFATLLYDTREGKQGFSRELCDMFDVNMDHLPQIVLSTDRVGGITGKAAAQLGLCEGTPVFSGGGDASLIGVGAGAVRLGDTHVYIGTSGWVTTVTPKQKLDVGSMIASSVGVDPDSFNCFAELETAGKCFEWAKKHIMMDDIELFSETKYNVDIETKQLNAYEYIMRKVADIPPGSNGVMFTPWIHGNRCPFEDPNARGMFFGIGIETTSADMYHAVVEGVCFHLKWQMEAMSKLVKPSDAVRFAGGGAIQDQTCQILANVLNKKIEAVKQPQNTGAVGAAAMIGIGLGEIDSVAAIRDMVEVERSFNPDPGAAKEYDRLFSVFKDLYKSNKQNFKTLHNL